MVFGAELLKALDYPEISYRKLCDLKVNDMERKKNRLENVEETSRGPGPSLRECLRWGNTEVIL